ncbi:MAG: hypothetical protein M3P45_00270 [Acidobacteriota bacterium]|nr:hypothetical protein [Acidobacteriota bacterium]
MLGFYEEMADFAAMSEDDGFLGQCAGEVADQPFTSSRTGNCTEGDSRSLPPRPRQLQLLTAVER